LSYFVGSSKDFEMDAGSIFNIQYSIFNDQWNETKRLRFSIHSCFLLSRHLKSLCPIAPDDDDDADAVNATTGNAAYFYYFNLISFFFHYPSTLTTTTTTEITPTQKP